MSIERTAQTYGPGVTGASKAVLLELMAVLRPYRDALVLVGGWAPYFLLEQHRRDGDPFVHVGSIDIDLAVDPATVNEPAYATIAELLKERGYRPAADRRGGAIPNSFERIVQAPITKKPYTIRVDFLTRPDDPRPGRQRHRVIQDELLARQIKGCEAAFAHQTTFELTGTLPDGGQVTVPIRMADVVASLAMKGIVLGDRYREKDAYDIYALAAHYQQGPQDVASALRPHLDDPLVSEGMAGVRTAFATREANGPAWVASFLVSPIFSAEHERLITDAFMVVNELNRLLSAPSPPLCSSKDA
jgi:hypothetical protein